ncbi:OsmC family protein [Sporosarcina oncorhynchi]|uniref:OsmC family protein n=1 Tax=Sporosarcina oncorhynchi TaxID=3056444 RepID=A0ABZ0L3Y7_9BACL|nr:OsmC family protein [Sporosarcina sp. T2O-4]WOV86623.1 OsmC family protein [Sporosarcina sp. T2O-4]
MKFEMTENGFQTETSYGTLQISGNDEFGFRPYQLLVSSIAVCSGGVMRKILERKRIPAKNITIDIKEVYRNEEKASRVERIHMHFIIEGIELSNVQMDKIMEVTANNCSMVQSVKDSIEVIETYEFVN